MVFSDSLSSQSYWHEISARPRCYPSLGEDVRTEVVIIGGGITGLSIALQLKSSGKHVVVLEAHRIGSGTTGGTSGHLDAVPDQGITKLVDNFGEESAHRITEGRLSAIDQIEAWTTTFKIPCEFARIPAFAYSESAEGTRAIQKEEDVATRLGLSVKSVAETPLPFATSGGLCFQNQARLHSLKYLYGLAEAFVDSTFQIYENTAALPPEDGEPCVIQTRDGARVIADQVILATHSAFLGISQLDARLAPFQSYVLTADIVEELPDALFWDDAKPYHYIRRAKGDDPHTIIVGGADHKTGQAKDEHDHLHALEAYTKSRFAVRSITQVWSAEFFEPADGVPYIGRVPGMKNTFIATGFQGTGLTYGTMASEVLRALILKEDHPLVDVVTPSRFKPLAAGKTLVRENMNVAQRFVGDRFGIDELTCLDEVANGEGRIARYEGREYAVYREPGGRVHLLSPACTHAGCFVQWNTLEKTWDCPCHGGRYTATGERLYGPPPHPLHRESD